MASPLSDEPRFVADLRLTPLTSLQLEAVCSRQPPLQSRGVWATRDRSLRHSDWNPRIHLSYVESARHRPVVDRRRLESFLCIADDDPPIAWCLRRDQSVLGLAMFGWGPVPADEEAPLQAENLWRDCLRGSRMVELVLCLPEDMDEELYSYLNPIPPVDTERVLASDLAARAARAIEAGARVVAVAAGLLAFLQDNMPADSAIREMLHTLGIATAVERVPRQPLTLDALRGEPDAWDELLARYHAFFHPPRDRPNRR